MEVVGRKFSHRPGNPATVGVVRWPAAGDTAGSSLRLLSSLQHRIYNLLDDAILEYKLRLLDVAARLRQPLAWRVGIPIVGNGRSGLLLAVRAGY